MKIFLSYPAEQRHIANEVFLRLSGEGHRVFFDRTDLAAGQSYDQRIGDEINASDLFLFLLTPESIKAGRYTLTELAVAEARWRHPEGHVLVVKLADVPAGDVPPYLSATTYLDPQGSPAAEVLLAVGKIERQRSRRWRPLMLGASALTLAGALAFIVLQIWIPNRSERARIKLAEMHLDYTADTLVESAKHGDVNAVTLFLQVGMDPNLRNEQSKTALGEAVGNGHRAVVQLLLAHGAEPDSGLIAATVHGDAELVRLLATRMSAGGTPMALTNGGSNGTDRVESMIESRWGSMITGRGTPRAVALWAAVMKNRLDIVRLLIEAGIHVNTTGEDCTPLWWAAEEAHPEIVRGLLDLGADANRKCLFDDVYPTPLFAATKNGDLPIVQLLLDHGARIEERSNGRTPLDVANELGKTDVAGALRERAARAAMAGQ